MAAIFGTPELRVLVLFGWLAGFTVVPEGLAAPYARTLGGGAPTIGLLLAAAPAGLLIGAFVLGRLVRPSDRLRPMGWLAMLACAPLIFCQVRPPLLVVMLLWAVAGAGGAYQLAAAAAFVRALPGEQQERAFAVAQSGLLAAQVLGILAAGAVAQRLGPPAAVALAGLLGLVGAAVLATDWIRRHAELLARLDAPDRPPALDRPPVPDHPPAPDHQTASNHQAAEHRDSLADTRPDGSLGPAHQAGQPTVRVAVSAPPPGPSAQLPGRSAPPLSRSAHPPGRSAHPPGRSAPTPGRRHAHRTPRDRRDLRDLPGEARLAAARLLDQILGDRRALPLFRDDDPRGQVDQRAHAECDHADSQEDEPDHGGVDAGILGDPGADTGHQPAVPRPD